MEPYTHSIKEKNYYVRAYFRLKSSNDLADDFIGRNELGKR
jgi:hypothetical protein